MLSTLRRPLTLAVATSFFALASCSDATGPRGSLTSEELNELAVQMGVGFSGGLIGSAAVTPSGVQLNAIPAPISASVDFTAPCPRGGSARIRGSVNGIIDNATESAELDVTATEEPNNCGYPVHGKTVRVTGSLTASAHVKIENGLPVGTHTASLVGKFDWRADDGRRGSCSVSYNASANYTTNVATVNGNFCGATIQVTGPLTTN